MLEARPSWTALHTASMRAQHQCVDDPRVLDDPLALRILGGDAVEPLDRPLHDGMRAFLAARSRFAEDRFAEAAHRGVNRCVILGAGLDTFALRNPWHELMVYEVDHPATQAWKREKIRESGLPEPAGLRFAPIDFETDGLANGLAKQGFAPDEPTIFSWLGVTYYLNLTAIEETLRFVACCGPGSEVVFDFFYHPELLEPEERAHLMSAMERVKALGEPFVSFFAPDELESKLRVLGFQDVEIITRQNLNARYFADRLDGLRVGGVGGMARAAVR